MSTASQDAEVNERQHNLERKFTSNIGDGNAVVDLSRCSLRDADVKLLVRLLENSEAASRDRLKAARHAFRLAEKAKAEAEAARFNPYEPDAQEDPEEQSWKESCNVQWDDDPLWVTSTNLGVGNNATGKEPVDDLFHPPLSYRFTPREERSEKDMARMRGTKHKSSGRARIIFRHAMHRYNLRQKSLIADAASLQVEYEDRGRGCEHLSLQNNLFGSRGVAHIGVLIRGSEALHSLALGGNHIGDTGAALIGRALPHGRALRALALQDCGIGSKGMRHLSAGLANNRNLASLWLFKNEAGDEGAAHLAAAMRTCRLEALGLEDNGVGLLGCEALAFALSLDQCPLTFLRLQHNALGDDGVHALCRALIVNRSLQKLELRDVGLGEKGCASLADAVQRHDGLMSLSLEDNELTPQSTEPLLRAQQASATLKELHLGMEHGGNYGKAHTADELRRNMTIAFLSKKRVDAR